VFKKGENENNFVAWEILGDTLVDLGLTADGVAALEEAVARCPSWAREFAEHVKNASAEADGPPAADPRVAFWKAVDVDAVRAKVVERHRAKATGA
jgi:hypothetical protein